MARRKRIGRTSYGTLRLSPATEGDLLALVVRHGLIDVPVPTVEPSRPRDKQTVARWFDTLAVDRTLRLMVGKAGERWLVTKNTTGMIEYAKVEGILSHMAREKAAGTIVGGETTAQKQARFNAWVKNGGA